MSLSSNDAEKTQQAIEQYASEIDDAFMSNVVKVEEIGTPKMYPLNEPAEELRQNANVKLHLNFNDDESNKSIEIDSADLSSEKSHTVHDFDHLVKRVNINAINNPENLLSKGPRGFQKARKTGLQAFKLNSQRAQSNKPVARL